MLCTFDCIFFSFGYVLKIGIQWEKIIQTLKVPLYSTLTYSLWRMHEQRHKIIFEDFFQAKIHFTHIRIFIFFRFVFLLDCCLFKTYVYELHALYAIFPSIEWEYVEIKIWKGIAKLWCE